MADRSSLLPTLLAGVAVALAIVALIVSIGAGSEESGDETSAPVATGNDASRTRDGSAELDGLRSEVRATRRRLDDMRKSVAEIQGRLADLDKRLDEAGATAPQDGQGTPQPAPDSGSDGQGGAPEPAPPQGGADDA